jgi:hypothetical protein
MPRVVRCPNCSAPLEVDLEQPVVRCQYCGCDVKQTIAIQTQPKPKPEPEPRPEPRSRRLPEPEVVDQRRPAKAPNIGRTIRFWVFFMLLMGTLPVLHQLGILRRIPELVRSAVRRVGGDEAARRAGAPRTETDADRQLGEKLTVYSECLSSNLSRAEQSRQRYLGWQSGEGSPAWGGGTPKGREAPKGPNRAGPSCKERYIGWGVPELRVDRGSSGCGHRVGEFDNKPPRLVALEEAADKFVIALHELDDVVGAAHHYYDQKDYVEDHCAKGKQLHTKMMEGFARLSAAETALRANLEAELPPLLERRLARATREDASGALAAYLKLLVDARQLFAVLRGKSQAGGAAEDPSVRPLLAQLEEDINSASAADRRQPRQTPIGSSSFDTWAKRAALDYLKTAKEVARGPVGAPRAGRRVPRSRHGASALVEKYNRFLQRMNAPLPAERDPVALPAEAESAPPGPELPSAPARKKAGKAGPAGKPAPAGKAAPAPIPKPLPGRCKGRLCEEPISEW